MIWEGKMYLPWQMIFYLTSGLITLIVVSLFTRPVAREKLDRLYACLRTPIAKDEPETAPFTLPPGVEPSARRPWIRHRDFEIPKPDKISLIGFFAGWVAVGILVALFYWVLSYGS